MFGDTVSMAAVGASRLCGIELAAIDIQVASQRCYAAYRCCLLVFLSSEASWLDPVLALGEADGATGGSLASTVVRVVLISQPRISHGATHSSRQ